MLDTIVAVPECEVIIGRILFMTGFERAHVV